MNPDCLKEGETYHIGILDSGWESVNYTIGITQLGNLKSDELDQHLKQMKVGDDKELTLTARLTDYATRWRWKYENRAKKDEQF